MVHVCLLCPWGVAVVVLTDTVHVCDYCGVFVTLWCVQVWWMNLAQKDRMSRTLAVHMSCVLVPTWLMKSTTIRSVSVTL